MENRTPVVPSVGTSMLFIIRITCLDRLVWL